MKGKSERLQILRNDVQIADEMLLSLLTGSHDTTLGVLIGEIG